MALALIILGGCFAVTATKSEASSNGTERDWEVALPHGNANYYFKSREKETDSTEGYVVVDDLGGASGVNVWFNTRNKKGTMVHMGIENQDNTRFFKDVAKGTVNYR